LRYFWDNPFDYQEHRLPLIDVEALHRQAKMDYYTRLPVDYAKTGQDLYQWLDQSDRLLSNALRQPRIEELILAIASDAGLAQLPWELLHDGQSFLVLKRPPVIPIRWVATGQAPIAIIHTPQNRPLNVLFMATSPLGVEPVLDYEAEEGQILTATQRTPVNLSVEESGCLRELGYLVRDYDTGYFDVFHLTGHATYDYRQPYFLTESEYGDRVDSGAEDLVDALGYPLPPLIFLSGCQTGYSSDQAIPSMAESLLKMGATTVLGWGERVRDTDATAAASALYQELATGQPMPQAIAATYQTLIQQQTRDWHKLRLYVGTTLPSGLVTPPRTKGRKQLPKTITGVTQLRGK
jgi:CHAT domain-containing protein